MSKKIETMTPDQIAAKGRELIRLAKRKEAELRQRQLVQIGEVFNREIHSGWSTPWKVLSSELELILGTHVPYPQWAARHHNTPSDGNKVDAPLPVTSATSAPVAYPD